MLPGNIAGQVDNLMKFALPLIAAPRTNEIYVEMVTRERNHDAPAALSGLLADVIEPGELAAIMEQILDGHSLLRLVTQSGGNKFSFGVRHSLQSS